MLKRIGIPLLMFFASTSIVVANTYKITSAGNLTEAAIFAFQAALEDQNTDINLSYVPDLADNRELMELLDAGTVDIAVVGFENVTALAGSPLLRPFLAPDAVKLRQTINSEVGAYAKASVEQEGYRVLDFWHVSSTILGSKTRVASVADLKGLKIYEGGGQRDDTLLALGAAPTQMAFAEVIMALEAGAIDSAAVPFDNRAQTLGFVERVQNYVDRLYKPRIYAVLVKEGRWKELPFADQHYFAKIAEEVGENLVGALEVRAAKFRSDELARGSAFNAWNIGDVAQVRLASLGTVDPDDIVARDLVNLAFDAAAAIPPPPDDNSEPRPANDVTLLFATDRELVDLANPDTAFSSARKLRGHTFGKARVGFKNGRRFGNDLKKVATIKDLSNITEDAFLALLTSAPERDIVIFIHGYNNAFADSIRRGGAIKEDIAADAIVISYTWPSDGELLSYGYDESSTDTAEQNFKLFMDKVTTNVSASRINIVAHSMGSRLLTKYLAGLPERGLKPSDIKFKNIVYAAADISTTFFKQKEEEPFDLNYPLSVYAEMITVYFSRYDRPLGLSHKLHRDQRLGLADQNTMYLEADIKSVDASLIDPAKWYQKFTFATRHSYLFDKSAGVRDLSMLLTGTDASSRPGMSQKFRNGLEFWELAP